MKRTRRPCLLLAVLLVAALSACGGDAPPAPDPDAPGWMQSAGEPITLDWYINFNWFTTTWDDSLVARTITEQTGVAINFIAPSGNEAEKLNSMISSGTLPDLVTIGHWEPQIDRMILDGQVWALNELADQHDAYFWQVAHPQRVAWYTRDDGNIYAYPNSSYAPSDYDRYDNIGSNQAFLVRRDIYESIGSPDMSTPAGFKAALRAAAESLPEVNGKPLIPIGLYDFEKDGCFSLEGILQNLLAVPFEKDGEVVDRYTDPDYIEWLKTFRELYGEGLVPDDVFVDRRVQMAEKVAEGRYFSMIYQHTDIADQQKHLYSQSPGSEYIAVDGPKNSRGDDHTLPGVGINGWTVTLISKNCKDPARAIRLMSYLMSEHGQLVTYCGVEGETYDMVDGKPRPRGDVLELLNTARADYNALYAADNTYWMLQDLAMQLDWQPPAQPPLMQPLQWTYPYTVYTAQYEPVFTAGTEAAVARQKIREEWGRALPRLITCGSEQEFDRIFADFLTMRDALGFATVQQESQRQMQQSKERLKAF